MSETAEIMAAMLREARHVEENTYSPSDGVRTVLIVDDDPLALVLTTQALEQAVPGVKVMSVAKGDVAMDCLNRRNGHEDTPRPDLVLLDWNIPLVHGRDVLARIRRDEVIGDIPVYVLSMSDSELDKHQAEDLGVTGYLVKDYDQERFTETLRAVIQVHG